jgi:hypothetical protein
MLGASTVAPSSSLGRERVGVRVERSWSPEQLLTFHKIKTLVLHPHPALSLPKEGEGSD